MGLVWVLFIVEQLWVFRGDVWGSGYMGLESTVQVKVEVWELLVLGSLKSYGSGWVYQRWRVD